MNMEKTVLLKKGKGMWFVWDNIKHHLLNLVMLTFFPRSERETLPGQDET